MVTGPGEHIFARHFLRPNLLEVVAGPSEHMVARHILRPDQLDKTSRPVSRTLLDLRSALGLFS